MTNTSKTKYIANWLASKTIEAPLIIASYSTNALDKAIEHVCHLNKGKEILFLENENGAYRIKKTRELIKTISQTPFSDQRLIIIQLAENLTLPAVNALLKSLEEPSLHNKWILTTKQLPLILPTIRSRCQILRMNNENILPLESSNEFWQELSFYEKKDKISEEALDALHSHLTQKINQEGPSTSIYRALLRLRDYHKIKSHRGNTKLARDVLLASLYQLRSNTR